MDLLLSFTATLDDTPVAKKSVRIVEENSSGNKIYIDNGNGTIVEEGRQRVEGRSTIHQVS